MTSGATAGRAADAAGELALVADFVAGRWPEDSLDHAGHVRLARAYLLSAPLQDVLGRFPADLLAYATRKGAPEIYHETITWAYLFAVHERLLRAPDGDTWAAFAMRHDELLTRGLAWVRARYEQATLESDLARRVFVLPDRGAPIAARP